MVYYCWSTRNNTLLTIDLMIKCRQFWTVNSWAMFEVIFQNSKCRKASQMGFVLFMEPGCSKMLSDLGLYVLNSLDDVWLH